MEALLSLLLILPMATHSRATWCICKEGASDAALQKTLDYACGEGADCKPTHQNGPCFNPNTVRAHCNYAVNSYFQKKGQTPGSCDFAGTAMLVTSDPSFAGCVYPACASANTTTTVTPVSSGTATPTINPPAGTSPLVTGPSDGVLGGSSGGLNNGFGPAGAGLYPFANKGLILSPNSSIIFSSMITLLFSVLVFWCA